MTPWIQHLFVLLLVLACLSFVARQAFSTLRGRKSKLGNLGSCCAKGCEAPPDAASKPKAERIIFMPVEMLRKRK